MRMFWTDTDTASDDAVALLMALRWPDVRVAGISVVAGNVALEQGGVNARYAAELCGSDGQVYEGPLGRSSGPFRTPNSSMAPTRWEG
ncbi:hypothetical protein BH23CHL2_BH23CHL2_11990 [soil metagenome]